MQLLWGQLVAGRRIAPAGGLAAGAELRACSVRPRRHPQLLERVERRTEVDAGVDPAPVAAEPFAVEQVGPGPIERRQSVGETEAVVGMALGPDSSMSARQRASNDCRAGCGNRSTQLSNAWYSSVTSSSR